MFFSYFTAVEDKYSTKVSLKKPIVIRLDGKGVTKSLKINMYDENEGGFAYALKIAARGISKIYRNTIVLASADEINVIFLDTDIFYKNFNSCKCQKSSSLITQDASLYFNSNYYGDRIYFDARTFNIEENKIGSYLRYRSSSIYNITLMYIAKRNIPFKDRKDMKNVELVELLNKSYPGALKTDSYSNKGICFYNGRELIVEKVLELDEFNYESLRECINKPKRVETVLKVERMNDFDDI